MKWQFPRICIFLPKFIYLQGIIQRKVDPLVAIIAWAHAILTNTLKSKHACLVLYTNGL